MKKCLHKPNLETSIPNNRYSFNQLLTTYRKHVVTFHEIMPLINQFQYALEHSMPLKIC